MSNQYALGGIHHLEKALGAVSHNIANTKTTGYRFQEVFSQELAGDRAKHFRGLGTNSEATRYTDKQGALLGSTKSTDLAISGPGFFIVQTPPSRDGAQPPQKRFSRDGKFTMDKDGNWVDNNKNKLMFAKGQTAKQLQGQNNVAVEPLKIDPKELKYIESIKINAEGQITIDYNKDGRDKYNKDSEILGTIPLAMFPREENARRLDGGYLVPTDTSGEPMVGIPDKSVATIRQGKTEASSTELTDQLTRMMIIQRGYQANSKALETQDKMIQNMIGTVQ